MSKKEKKRAKADYTIQDSPQDNLEASQDHLAAAAEPVDAQAGHAGHSGGGERPAFPSPATGALEQRIGELTGDLQRLQAEFANYQRREVSAKAELMDVAKQQVVLQLLPLLDNIDRALAHRPQELDDNAWASGVEQVGKQAQATLGKMGVERIEAAGQPFDHNLHEAVGIEEGEGDDEVVIEELQPGYRMGDRVVRHAMVRVGRK